MLSFYPVLFLPHFDNYERRHLECKKTSLEVTWFEHIQQAIGTNSLFVKMSQYNHEDADGALSSRSQIMGNS